LVERILHSKKIKKRWGGTATREVRGPRGLAITNILLVLEKSADGTVKRRRIGAGNLEKRHSNGMRLLKVWDNYKQKEAEKKEVLGSTLKS